MSDLTGQTLGKYQLLDRLGRGGMADVYKGYQPGLDRYVAVKVMHPHLSEDANFITRFRREAKSVAELHHANIVQVFDFDVQADNYYMVMEYIEGGLTLKQRLQDLADHGTRLSIDQTLDIIAKLADALAYAHNLGMIHRDIKPANVLLASLDRPVLSDFGIARLLNETGLTSSGVLIGTPAYMSPEQGRGERIDGRSDIYSLGIVLYEMLTGQPPYDADTPYAIILKHINDPLTPPHLLIDPMPEVVERVVLKCLAKNPDDRFASMAELRDALRGAQSAIGTQRTTNTLQVAAATLSPQKSQPAVPPTVATPAPEPIVPESVPGQAGRGLKPAYVIGGAVGVIALLIVAIVLIIAPRPPAPPPVSTAAPIAAAPMVETPAGVVPATPFAGDSKTAQLIADGYQELFMVRDNSAAYDLFAQAVNAEPDNAHAYAGRAVAELKRYGDLEAATADLDRAARTIPADPFVHYGRGLAQLRAVRPDEEAAEQEFTQAIEGCGDNAALCSAVYVDRGQLRAESLDKVKDGLADIDRAIELYPDQHEIDWLYPIRARIRFELNDDLDGAIKDLQAAYDLSKWPEHLQQAAVYAVKAFEYERALSLYDQLLEKAAGDPRYLADKAFVAWLSGDQKQATQSVERALQLKPDLLSARYLQGLLLLEADQPQEALRKFEPISQAKSMDLYDMSQPFLNPHFGHEIFYDMARAAVADGDSVAAQEYLSQSLQNEKFWSQPYILQAEILKDQGDLAGARESYLKARDYAYDEPDLQAEIDQALADLAR
jgi:tRNA A-37 threonylcarbamoyl transferase component Bud32